MPQFQIITMGIVSIAIFLNWLVFSGTTFNIGFTSILAIAFLVVSILLLFWVFFMPDGKAFAHKYNKLQYEKAIAERQLISSAEALLERSSFQQLINEHTGLSTFTEVAEWDRGAELQIQRLIGGTQTLEEIVQQAKILRQWTLEQYKAKYRKDIESMVERLQEAIDCTPNSPATQQALLKELRQRKKELQLQKREVGANMKAIRKNARVQSVYAGRGLFGIGYDSKIAARERRNIRYAREAAWRQNENIIDAIEHQILQIDKDIMWVEHFKN